MNRRLLALLSAAGLDALRALCLGGPTARPLTEASAWIAAILAVTMPLAIIRYRRTTAT